MCGISQRLSIGLNYTKIDKVPRGTAQFNAIVLTTKSSDKTRVGL